MNYNMHDAVKYQFWPVPKAGPTAQRELSPRGSARDGHTEAAYISISPHSTFMCEDL